MPDQHDAGEGEWKNPKVLWRVKPIQARKAERRYDVDVFDRTLISRGNGIR